MDEELVRIVATAAAGLVVRAVGTAGWQRIRSRITGVFGRGRSPESPAVAVELDSAAARVLAADPVDRPGRVDEVEHELRGSFRTWMRTEPDLLGRLQTLVDDEQGAVGEHTTVAQLMMVHDGVGVMSGRDTRIGSVSRPQPD